MLKALSRRGPLLAGLYFLALSLAMTWPLALRMGSAVAGYIGDNVYFIWLIGWFQKALFEMGANPFDVWFLNYPQGWSLAYTEISPAQVALALPFSLIGGPVFAYNVTMLLSFALAGRGMCLWVRRLTGRWDAGLAAGTVFAFTPYHQAHFLAGHLNLAGLQWFPFYFMGLYDLLRAPRPSWRPVLLSGVMLGLIGLTSQYYLYMTVLVSAAWALVDFLYARRVWLQARTWQSLGGMAAVAAPFVLAAAGPFLALAGQGALPDRDISMARMYSASPLDYLLPYSDHFLLGPWVSASFNRDLWIEASLYPGLAALALAGVALAQRRSLPHRRLLPLLAWGGLFALVLSLGTDLHWNGAPVELPLPGVLAGRLGRETVPLVLPGYFFFRYLPYFAKMRVMMRFGMFVGLFLSAAAGLGAAWLLARLEGRKFWLAALGLIGLVLLEVYPGPYPRFSTVQASPVDVWLAGQPGEGAVIQFPFRRVEDQDRVYATLAHGKPFVGGFFNAFPPEQYLRIRPVMETFPAPQALEKLCGLDVQYVLVDRAEYPQPGLTAELEAAGLRYRTEMDGQLVFETDCHE